MVPDKRKNAKKRGRGRPKGEPGKYVTLYVRAVNQGVWDKGVKRSKDLEFRSRGEYVISLIKKDLSDSGTM